ncbi:uncharacterized protein PGTG_15431 [Puccinia graminis f. sp. tritici CRL 75-36-700-3]|uniref:Uncharacterized protein n=1 Tax=Puccinia graminis f. sp. tritici (strain CRL 75-36-700-3 / race SCCL) TaxID=418459 RepID=E3KZQ0_PUCGT|nr:uncharacterized protein PGTG_15431 [Puccinia graminis f. sp. tritici CRL 75-36-700-3]EFP89775.2 hypothetical protein PGTG_15431 [Puccinia graminis f. sp. tritici CRL 75-36-700-3]
MVDEISKRATRSAQQKGSKTTAIEESLSSQLNTSTHATGVPPQNITTATGNDRTQQMPNTGPENDALELDSKSEESDTFKDLPDNNPKEGAGNITRYKEILSNVPTIITTDDLLVSHQNPTLNQDTPPLADPDNPTPIRKSDKSTLWDKIAEAVAANDKVNADFFIRLYSQINDTSNALKPDILRSRSNDAVNPQIVSSTSKKAPEKTSIIFNYEVRSP